MEYVELELRVIRLLVPPNTSNVPCREDNIYFLSRTRTPGYPNATPYSRRDKQHQQAKGHRRFRVGYSAMRSSLLLFLGCITHLAHAHSYGPPPRLPAPIFVNPQQQHAPNCYGFPDQPFTGSNYVNICDPSGCGDDGLGVKTNDVAPNFQLSAVSGEARHDLYALLQSKPVFIQFGSYT